MSMSEAVKEIRFIYSLLRSLGISVTLPIVVHTDNIGAIFMAENSSSGMWTRHFDTRYHFICKHVAYRKIKIICVMTVENHADIFTKNVNRETYKNHVAMLLGKIMED